MIEQNNSMSEMCYPAEGRCDIAIDLEEERLYAYSIRQAKASSVGTVVLQKQQDRLVLEPCHPAEGRCDIAADLDEEQRNAYSARRAGRR